MANPQSAPAALVAGRTIIVVRDRDDRELDRESIPHPLTVSATVSALARLRERNQQRRDTATTAGSSAGAAPAVAYSDHERVGGAMTPRVFSPHAIGVINDPKEAAVSARHHRRVAS